MLMTARMPNPAFAVPASFLLLVVANLNGSLNLRFWLRRVIIIWLQQMIVLN